MARRDDPASTALVIEDLHGITAAREVEQLQMRIWGSDESWIVPSHVLYIVADYGGILLGARLDGALVGFVVGFLGRQRDELFHASHMLGVLPGYQHHGIGAALKWGQRARAQEQGLELMTWTFDPLEARNAYFNLHKLGATSRTYREDFYGPMEDELNRGLPSDRLLVEWDLDGSRKSQVARLETSDQHTTATRVILRDQDGTPELHLGDTPLREPVAVQVPRDFQAVKRESPDRALAWRLAVRRAFQWALDQGYEAQDFKGGAYILEKGKQ